jgi:hypothetical protein
MVSEMDVTRVDPEKAIVDCENIEADESGDLSIRDLMPLCKDDEEEKVRRSEDKVLVSVRYASFTLLVLVTCADDTHPQSSPIVQPRRMVHIPFIPQRHPSPRALQAKSNLSLREYNWHTNKDERSRTRVRLRRGVRWEDRK